jgi:hypothetical protein
MMRFAVPVVLAFACTNQPDNLQQEGQASETQDTVYSTTTQRLRSDRIPDSVFQMTALKHLAISGMDCHQSGRDCWMISEIPSAIKNLEQLRSLSLTLQAIERLPLELAALKDLESLDLTDNANLSDIGVITQMQGLKHLYLFGCRLTKLPADLSGLKKLERLGLTGNNLSDKELQRVRKALLNCEIIFER